MAHLQAIFFPIFLGIKSINQFNYFKNKILIPIGFIFLGLASMFEMIDHTKTDWIYVNHSSFYNWLFYSFIALGLTALSISVLKNRLLIISNSFMCLSSIISYWLLGKSIALVFQVIISIFLIIIWQKTFKDWILIAYPIFGIFLTTFLGTNLSLSGNQTWHIFIGPSGTISVLTFYLVLLRSKNRIIREF